MVLVLAILWQARLTNGTISFISRLIKLTISKLVNWIHDYIARHEYSEYVEGDVKAHIMFYSVCQAFFHLFLARHKEFVALKNGERTFSIKAHVTSVYYKLQCYTQKILQEL